MKILKNIFYVIMLVVFTFIGVIPSLISAQTNSVDVMSTYEVKDNQVVDGDIIVSSDQGLVRATSSNSSRIFGVIQANPLIVYKSVNDTNKAIARSGTAKVNVTTFNGSIKSGDPITSSPIAGKGQKSIQSGYIIGIALEDFNDNSGQKVNYQNKQVAQGQILIAIRIEYMEIDTARSATRLFDKFNAALFNNLDNPQQSIRIFQYLAAVMIVLIGFTVSFFTFSRSIAKSIEAIGRNPAARKSIQMTVIINSILTIIIAVIAVFASVLILRM